jgi:hypothetical protein
MLSIGFSSENSLSEKNKIWSKKYAEVIIKRNKLLTKKYGPHWYTDSIIVTIPKEELVTEEMEKLRQPVEEK